MDGWGFAKGYRAYLSFEKSLTQSSQRRNTESTEEEKKAEEWNSRRVKY
jgi:hypothetical protein